MMDKYINLFCLQRKWKLNLFRSSSKWGQSCQRFRLGIQDKGYAWSCSKGYNGKFILQYFGQNFHISYSIIDKYLRIVTFIKSKFSSLSRLWQYQMRIALQKIMNRLIYLVGCHWQFNSYWIYIGIFFFKDIIHKFGLLIRICIM